MSPLTEWRVTRSTSQLAEWRVNCSTLDSPSVDWRVTRSMSWLAEWQKLMTWIHQIRQNFRAFCSFHWKYFVDGLTLSSCLKAAELGLIHLGVTSHFLPTSPGLSWQSHFPLSLGRQILQFKIWRVFLRLDWAGFSSSDLEGFSYVVHGPSGRAFTPEWLFTGCVDFLPTNQFNLRGISLGASVPCF